MKKNIKYCLAKFIKFVKNDIDISTPFTIKLVDVRSTDLKTYAYYDKEHYCVAICQFYVWSQNDKIFALESKADQNKILHQIFNTIGVFK